MDNLKEQLLEYYSLSEEDYLSLTKDINEVHLLDPNMIEGMDKVKERIFSAIKNKEKIIIYGDYDCDGITSTSIMVETFKKLNYPVEYYIPSRYIDGYGLNVNNVVKIAENGYNLIICVDNGISAHEAIDKAVELGIDVLVIDHHEVPEEPVKAVGVIHPTVSHIGKVVGSAGYMSLFVSGALLGYYDDYLLTLGGLSVVSDMMELKDINRDVVRLAIDTLKKKRFERLISLTENETIDEKTFGLEIAPKINAIARIITNKNVNLLVKYLTSNDLNYVASLHDWIISTNEKRKELTKVASETIDESELIDKKGIVLKLDVLEGLIGLIANKLLGTYNVPVLIFTSDEAHPGILKGSIRSKEGFNVTKAFESLNKYLLTGGGHAFAGGLSIKEEDFDSFKVEFEELCEKYQFTHIEKPSIKIELKDITMENYRLIQTFAPFGVGFNEPLFKIENLPTRGLTFISYGKHLSTALSIQSKLLGFNMNELEVKKTALMDIYGTFYLNNKYKTTLEFRINEYVPK